jgi:hypothetical protein
MLKRSAMCFLLALLASNFGKLFANNISQLVVGIQEPMHITKFKEFDGTKGPEIINLNNNGEIIVDSNAKLELKNIIIIGAGNNNIRCTDETGKIVLQNVIFKIENDYSWNIGNIDLQEGYFCVIGHGLVYFNRGTVTIKGNVQINAFCDCMYFDIDNNVKLLLEPQSDLATSTYETIRYLSDKQKIFPTPQVVDVAEKSLWQRIAKFLGF